MHLARPQPTLIEPEIQLAYKGSTATITCKKSDSVPVWRKSGDEPFDYTVIEPFNGKEETIAIEKLTFNDTGHYSCIKTEEGFRSHHISKLYVGG